LPGGGFRLRDLQFSRKCHHGGCGVHLDHDLHSRLANAIGLATRIKNGLVLKRGFFLRRKQR